MKQVPLASRIESEIAAAEPRVADDDGIDKPPPANPKVPPPPPNNSPLIKAKTPAAAVSADHIAQYPHTGMETRISSSTHSFFLPRSCPPRVCFNLKKVILSCSVSLFGHFLLKVIHVGLDRYGAKQDTSAKKLLGAHFLHKVDQYILCFLFLVHSTYCVNHYA